MKVERSSWLRRKFELWLMRKFMLRYGPRFIERRGYWWFIDYRGDVWGVEPTGSHEPGCALRMWLVDRAS